MSCGDLCVQRDRHNMMHYTGGHNLVVERYAKEQQAVGPNLLFDG